MALSVQRANFDLETISDEQLIDISAKILTLSVTLTVFSDSTFDFPFPLDLFLGLLGAIIAFRI